MAPSIKASIAAIALFSSSAFALELNLSDHFSKLGGSQEDNVIPFNPNIGYTSSDLDSLMSKYSITRWEDNILDARIGISSNSIFLLITNKTDTYVEYKLEIADKSGAKVGFHPSRWFNLMPGETKHLAGTPFSYDKNQHAVLDLNILSRKKQFESDVHKNFSSVIYSENKPVSSLGDGVFSKTVIFPHHEIYRNDPTKEKMQHDLKKVDEVLSLAGKTRNQVGLTDVRTYLNRKSDKPIMGVYDQQKSVVIVTTGNFIPTTTLTKFDHESRPDTNYYFFSESVTDYAGGLKGSAYSLLFSEKKGVVEILYENKMKGYVNLISVSELVTFPESSDSLFIVGENNNGISSSRFVAKLHDHQFVDVVNFSRQSEEGHEECPENPFFICG